MAIRDIVTRGYGNGTYDPGVNKLPVRGYTIGAGAATRDAVLFFDEQMNRAEFSGGSLSRAGFFDESLSRASFTNESLSE